ncbi:hypothetical protein GEMRC1_014188 [Eukaryota sp. GEM-RC1]
MVDQFPDFKPLQSDNCVFSLVVNTQQLPISTYTSCLSLVEDSDEDISLNFSYSTSSDSNSSSDTEDEADLSFRKRTFSAAFNLSPSMWGFTYPGQREHVTNR